MLRSGKKALGARDGVYRCTTIDTVIIFSVRGRLERLRNVANQYLRGSSLAATMMIIMIVVSVFRVAIAITDYRCESPIRRKIIFSV